MNLQHTNDLSTPQGRLRHFIAKYFKSVTNYAEVLGVSQGSLNTYVRLKNPNVFEKPKPLERLEKTGLSAKWYLEGVGEMVIPENLEKIKHQLKEEMDTEITEQVIKKISSSDNSDNINKHESKKVNGEEIYLIPKEFQGMLANIKLHIMSVHAATGTLTDLNDLPTTYMPLALGMNIDSDTHHAIYVNGQSMEDSGVTTGDIIIFEDYKKIPDVDCMIVGSLNGMPFLKYLSHRSDGSIVLKSNSKGVRDIILGDLEEIVIFGIVKKIIKDYAPIRMPD